MASDLPLTTRFLASQRGRSGMSHVALHDVPVGGENCGCVSTLCADIIRAPLELFESLAGNDVACHSIKLPIRLYSGLCLDREKVFELQIHLFKLLPSFLEQFLIPKF